MKAIYFILLIFSFTNASSQLPPKIIGYWTIYEVSTDRIYKNFETDSTFFFQKEDQEKMNSKKLSNDINEVLKFYTDISITIDKNSIITWNVSAGVLDKKKFTYDAKINTLIFEQEDAPGSVTFNAENILIYDLSDEYKTQILKFKKKAEKISK